MADRARLLKLLQKEVDASKVGEFGVGGRRRPKTHRKKKLAAKGLAGGLAGGKVGGGHVGGAKKASSREQRALEKKHRSDGAKSNPWVQFLKKWASARGLSYSEALGDPAASAAYRGQEGAGRKKRAAKKKS